MSKIGKVFGIDLGTTYSCIAYIDENNKPVVLQLFILKQKKILLLAKVQKKVQKCIQTKLFNLLKDQWENQIQT